MLALAVLVLTAASALRPQSPPAAERLENRLAGAWRELEADPPRLLGFTGLLCVQSLEGSQTVFRVEYGEAALVRTPCGFGDVLREEVALADGVLTLTYPGGNVVRFERVDPAAAPADDEAVRLDPIPLGSRDPSADERADLRAELAARVERDQEVRRRMGPLLQVPPEERGIDALKAVGDEMRAVDLDNTRFLVELVRDVGWIDAERFGEEARRAAFLIVQHSPSLRLMATVLPVLETEANADPATGDPYAYLYDRLQLSLCGQQRYGTQLHVGPDGTHYVVRLDDPAGVDERRASLGMGPLEEYLDLFRASGTRVVIGDLPAAVAPR